MDDLIRRAELAIGESRWIKSEVHQSLAKARMAVAQVQSTMQLARAEKYRAATLVNRVRDLTSAALLRISTDRTWILAGAVERGARQ